VSEPNTINTPIADEAKDLMPETWYALAKSSRFGPGALERRHNAVVRKIFGQVLGEEDQESLHHLVLEYAGKFLAFVLIDPAIDYWSKQIMSISVGERESARTYKDRVEDLKDLKKRWELDLANLYLQIEPLLPVTPGVARDQPRVVQAGDTVEHLTPSPYDLERQFALPEETGTT
jgi:hypothetical protein